jgi:hypothetical protein
MSEFLPDFITPAELAKHTGWSERNIRSLARRIGACRIIGRRMVLTKADVDAILEASRPKSSTPTPAVQPTGDYEALTKLLERRRRQRQPNRG